MAQLVLSAIGVLLMGGSGGVLLVLGAVKVGEAGWSDSTGSSYFGLGWVALTLAALALPSVLTAARRLQGRALPAVLPGFLRPASVLLIVWLGALALGTLAGETGTLSVFLPLLKIAAVIIPIGWLVEVGRSELSGGSAQRLMGVLGVSVLATPFLVMLLDLFVFLVVLLVGLIWMGMRPDVGREMQTLFQQISIYNSDPQALMNVLMPYLQTPGFRFALLGMLSGLVPLVEELGKPLALWLLAGKRITPAEGFVAGLIAGGGFALVETLGVVNALPDSAWLMTALQRTGTALLHILCVGLTGWGLASAWSEARFLRLALAFAAAVSLHAVWNALSVSSPLFFEANGVQIFGLLFMSLVMLAVLLRFNHLLRREQALEKMRVIPVVESNPVNLTEN